MRKPSRIIQGISRVAGALVGRRDESPAEDERAPAPPKPHERRRDSRSEIAIPGYQNDYVRVHFPPADTAHLVSDLSMRGLSVNIHGAEHFPAQGSEAEAMVTLGDAQLAATLFIAHRNEELAGCHVVNPSSDWLKEVARVLDPIRMGKRLREIDPSFVRQDGGALEVRWFQSGPACDLYVWSHDDGRVAKAQLFFDWQIVEWAEGRALRVGRAATAPGRGGGHPSADLFEFGEIPDPEILGASQRLMNAAKQVPEEIRALFLP